LSFLFNCGNFTFKFFYLRFEFIFFIAQLSNPCRCLLELALLLGLFANYLWIYRLRRKHDIVQDTYVIVDVDCDILSVITVIIIVIVAAAIVTEINSILEQIPWDVRLEVDIAHRIIQFLVNLRKLTFNSLKVVRSLPFGVLVQRIVAVCITFSWNGITQRYIDIGMIILFSLLLLLLLSSQDNKLWNIILLFHLIILFDYRWGATTGYYALRSLIRTTISPWHIEALINYWCFPENYVLIWNWFIRTVCRTHFRRILIKASILWELLFLLLNIIGNYRENGKLLLHLLVFTVTLQFSGSIHESCIECSSI